MLAVVQPTHPKRLATASFLGAGFLAMQYSGDGGAPPVDVIDTRYGTGVVNAGRAGTGITNASRTGTGKTNTVSGTGRLPN